MQRDAIELFCFASLTMGSRPFIRLTDNLFHDPRDLLRSLCNGEANGRAKILPREGGKKSAGRTSPRIADVARGKKARMKFSTATRSEARDRRQLGLPFRNTTNDIIARSSGSSHSNNALERARARARLLVSLLPTISEIQADFLADAQILYHLIVLLSLEFEFFRIP